LASTEPLTSTEKTELSTGPVVPTERAAVAHRPLGGGGARLTGGILRDWQRRNREASLPLALKQLERAGNLANLRLAVAAVTGRASGPGPASGTGPGADAGMAGADSGPWAASGGAGGYRGPVFMDSDLYKTLEAVGWELAHGAAGALTGFTDEAASLLEQAQQPDGYLNSYIQVTGEPRYAQLASSHEMYCAGHLIQAGIAYSRTCGDNRVLQIATRFADHLVATFAGREIGLDGHPVVETALVELYRQTGRASYLDLARQFVDQRGHGLAGDFGRGRRYLQDHRPVRETTEEVGHAVRALYLEHGVVDVAVETGDEELLASSVTRWDDMVATKTSLTGGNGSRHADEAFGDSFELPPDRAYNETCAAIASFQWSWRLLLATGEARYADLMERVLYNAFAAAISADGTRFFYVNPLQRREGHFERDDPGRRREWFSCACCPPNIMRLLASLEHYIATTAGDVLHVHLFTPARMTARLAGGTFEIEAATGYPWSGQIELRVLRAPAGECGLAPRLPGWAGGASVHLDGQPLTPTADGHGYLVIRRRWQPGDTVTLGLPVRPRLTFPHRRIDALRGTAAIERGPLVYCFEQADQPAGTALDDIAIRPRGLTERPRILDGAGQAVTVETDAVRLPAAPHRGLPYMSRPGDEGAGDPVTATAIPYFQWDNRDGRAMRVWMPLLGR